MEKKEINLQIENPENTKQKKFSIFSSTTPFLHIDAKRRKSSINYSKLKFNQNILIDILKKANLRKIYNNLNTHKNTHTHTYLNSNNNSENKNILYKNYKLSYNLNKKFHDLPVLSNFHNITDETINDLIKSDGNNNDFKSITKKTQKLTNLKTNFNYKNDKVLKTKRNNTYFFNKKSNNNFDRRHSNKNNSYNKKRKDLNRPISKQRSIKIKLNDLYVNYANSFPYFKNKKQNINYSENNIKKKNNMIYKFHNFNKFS